MLKCLDCGHIFTEDEIECRKESRGEFWGMSAYETVSGCPYCFGDYEQVFMCENCGGYFSLDELDDNYLCEDCRQDEE